MGRQPDYVKKKFSPLLQKTLKNVLAHRIKTEFPRIGGPRIVNLCVEIILQVVKAHFRSRDCIAPGQLVWMAVDVNDPPSRGKRIAETELVPVVLDVSTPGDIQRRLERQSPRERLKQRAIRVCHQAYEQGGLLSNCDVAELLNSEESVISTLLVEAQREQGQVVPRRATIHDVGTGLTHKRIICWKHYKEGKLTPEIARETYHSTEAVDRYLGQYDRVRYCRNQGMSLEKTAFTLNCSRSLVQEYLAIENEISKPPENKPKIGKEKKN